MSCAKHFPGHGDTNLDSHMALPTDNREKGRLLEHELEPFKMAVEEEAGRADAERLLAEEEGEEEQSSGDGLGGGGAGGAGGGGASVSSSDSDAESSGADGASADEESVKLALGFEPFMDSADLVAGDAADKAHIAGLDEMAREVELASRHEKFLEFKKNCAAHEDLRQEKAKKAMAKAKRNKRKKNKH